MITLKEAEYRYLYGVTAAVSVLALGKPNYAPTWWRAKARAASDKFEAAVFQGIAKALEAKEGT